MRNRTLSGLLTTLLLAACVLTGNAQDGKTVYTINDGWKFLPAGAAYAETRNFPDDKWPVVSLPHSWNAEDPFDDDLTYRRGISWYRRELELPPSFKDRQVHLFFEGVGQAAEVYVNGYFAGRHKGAYTGFAIDITPYLNWKDAAGRNQLAVQVSNAHDPMIAPLSVGYASYGGIYRDVWIMATGKTRFQKAHPTGAGVRVTMPGISKEQSGLNVEAIVSNNNESEKDVILENELIDPDGRTVIRFQSQSRLKPGTSAAIVAIGDKIQQPQLWSPDRPALYKLVSRLKVDGKVTDETVNRIGFRWFRFDDDGFWLNGEKLVLKGTNRHQDMLGRGDALGREDHRRDMEIIRNMGCNFLRLAHYPQTAFVKQLADELGLLIWEEIPVVNYVTDHQEFEENCINMIREMIDQGYNHPSVVMWGSSNEILLHGPGGERIGRHTDTAYLRVVHRISKKLDSTVRAEDPTRYSTVAMHISADYRNFDLDTISQVVGYNIYSGWYSGHVNDFGNTIDRYRKKGRPLFISEYGAEGEVRLNTEEPVRMDYTGQYQRYFHENYLRQIQERSWLAGTAIWNEIDFSQPNIGGPQPHRNQKGLVTWDRRLKDSYFFYKANWNPEPMVYVATRDWPLRAGTAGASATIDVYSNGTTVQLTLNGQKLAAQKVNNLKRATWKVKLKEGKNLLEAASKINGIWVYDQTTIDNKVYPTQLATGLTKGPLAINVGSRSQYADPSGEVWIEDRSWTAGSFGHIGGRGAWFDRREVITHTDDEPLYYSYQDSISGYRFDVPEGRYKVTLRFAEPSMGSKGRRRFNISFNDTGNTGWQYPGDGAIALSEAWSRDFIIAVDGNEGLQVSFQAVSGAALLNGIRIEPVP